MTRLGVTLHAWICCLFLVSGAEARAPGGVDLHALRQEYNAVSAKIDSLVRAMEGLDPQALDAKRLPEGEDVGLVPDGMSLVLIFWADDEARVWINDYLVGETRLAPIEVAVPPLYLRNENRIRARCWDTDQVESGFLCGLYLRGPDGALRPALVSDDSWTAAEGSLQEITYAHPVPDIPGAKVIWATQIFGANELSRTFGPEAIRQAAAEAPAGFSPKGLRKQMDYHAFLRALALLKDRRNELQHALETDGATVPGYAGVSPGSLSLTLGKAGPLKESASIPVAEEVKAWARKLPEAQKRLIYPDRRELKGEEAAVPSLQQPTPTSGAAGQRQTDYRPPDEGRPADGSTGQKGKAGGLAAGSQGQPGAGGGGGSSGGRSSRLGLWLPTLILAGYMGYAILRWQDLTGGGTRYPWGN